MKEKKREESERKILRGEKHRTRPIIFSDKRNDEDEKKKKKRSMKKKMKSKRICKSRQSVSFISSRVSRLAECLRLNIPI